MRIIAVFLFISSIWCISCDHKVSHSDIEGVWSFYSEELQYAEILIDSFQIEGMNSAVGSMLPIPFIIRNDSLHYTKTDFSALIQLASDTMFLLLSDSITYVFSRLDDSLRHVYGRQHMEEKETERHWDALWERACSQHGDKAYKLYLEKNFDLVRKKRSSLDSLQSTESIPILPEENE